MPAPIMAAMLSCSGTTLSDAEKKLLATANPLGITLFSRNIADRGQLQNLIKEIKDTIGRENVLIAVDQEGGRVRRLTEPEFRSYTHPLSLGALPPLQAERAAFLHAALISADLQELGINWNYAPMLDIAFPQTSPVLKSRCFSSSELVVTRLGKAMADEYINNSICPCIKHLPGHGRAAVDPHLSLPRLDYGLEELSRDFYPFQQLNYVPAGMTAHIIVSAIDDTRPVTQSPRAIKELIRGIIGFNGLLISDAVDMHALQGTLAEKTLASLNAGCDCICYALGEYAGLTEIASVCPPLTEQGLERFEAVAQLCSRPYRPRPDLATLAEEYQRIIGSIEPYKDDYDATEVLNRLKHKGDNKC